MPDSSTAMRDDVIAQILSDMQALQKKVEMLEECISRHNMSLPSIGIGGGGNSDRGNLPAKESGTVPSGLWHGTDSITNEGRHNYYHAIESRTSQPSEKYPADSYSMMVLNAPPYRGEWPFRKKIFFGVGLYVAMIQIASLIILTCGAVMDDSRAKLGGGNTSIVRVSQILSLSFYVVFPDASLHDFVRALQYYPRSELANEGDPVTIMKLACILRGFQGLLAVVPAWLLIMTSDSVIDVLLSFAAINMISNFDEAAFAIARTGAMGPIYKQEVKRIENEEVPPSFCREVIHVRYWMGVGLLNIATLVAMVLAWGYDPNDLDD